MTNADKNSREYGLMTEHAAAHAARVRLERERDDEIRFAKGKITDKFAERIRAARAAENEAQRAISNHRSETASHPLEGKLVQRRESSGWAYMQKKGKMVLGIVEVRRNDTKLPANLASYSLPAMGDAFVRLLKKNGKPGLAISTSRKINEQYDPQDPYVWGPKAD